MLAHAPHDNGRASVVAVLPQWFEWPSFSWLNLVLAITGLAGAVLVVPRGRAEHPPRFVGLGAVLSLLAVGGIVLGIIEPPERGGHDPLALATAIDSSIAVTQSPRVADLGAAATPIAAAAKDSFLIGDRSALLVAALVLTPTATATAPFGPRRATPPPPLH